MPFRITSPATPEYSCISWSVWVDNQVVWPDEDSQLAWPPSLPRVETVANFRLFYEMAGFSVCQTSTQEPGFEKIAIYAIGDIVKHAARQLASGAWTSKLGPQADVGHDTAEALLGDNMLAYGQIALVMSRRSTGRAPILPEMQPPPFRLIASDGSPLLR